MKTNVNFFAFKCSVALYALLTLYVHQEETGKIKNVSPSIFELLTDVDSPPPRIIILSPENFWVI